MDLDLVVTGTVTLWEYLPLLVRAKSPESIELILQTLWRTRKTGLDPSDRFIISDMLNLQEDALLDPVIDHPSLLYSSSSFSLTESSIHPFFTATGLPSDTDPEYRPGNLDEVGIQGLFPSEILPELCGLLTLLLMRLQRGWREDLLKDQAPLPRFKSMKWSMLTTTEESVEPVALVKLELHNNAKICSGDSELMFCVSKDASTNMLTSIRSLREQLSGAGETSNSAVS